MPAPLVRVSINGCSFTRRFVRMTSPSLSIRRAADSAQGPALRRIDRQRHNAAGVLDAIADCELKAHSAAPCLPSGRGGARNARGFDLGCLVMEPLMFCVIKAKESQGAVIAEGAAKTF